MNSARLNVLADRGRRLGPAIPLSPLPEEVPLPDSVKLALTLGASAEGITVSEFVQQAICEKAGRIGLPQLTDSFARVPKTPDRESAGGAHPLPPPAQPRSEAKASEDNGATVPDIKVPADSVAGDASRLAGGRTPDEAAFPGGLTISGPWSKHDAGCLAAVPEMMRVSASRFASGP